MELVWEIFGTAALAVFFSFVIAKLVSSVISSASVNDSVSDSSKIGDRDVEEELIMEELLFHQRLQVQGSGTESRAEFVEQLMEEVDGFAADSVRADEDVESEGAVEIENRDLTKGSVEQSSEGMKGGESGDDDVKTIDIDAKLASADQVAVQQSEDSAERKLESDPAELKEAENTDYSHKDSTGDERVPLELPIENDVMEEAQEIKESEPDEEVDKRKVVIESDEDDWEGIERSELEKEFAEAAKFLDEGERLGGVVVGNDVQMELYGLHKVATEGPCREHPPMPLKVFARAKWNAWQKLGNMSPEMAMEQYISLVSERVSGWAGGKAAEDDKLASSEAANPGAVKSDLGMFSSQKPEVADERNPELKLGDEKSEASGDSNLENMAKE